MKGPDVSWYVALSAFLFAVGGVILGSEARKRTAAR